MEKQSEPIKVAREACNGKGHRSIICTSQSRLRNIITLPAETLSEICQLACDDASDFKTRNLENFQLVCRTFRCIAIGTLQVWSCVDDSMSLERMELQLSRSGWIGMSFRIAFDGRSTPPSCKCPQWKLMKDHHSRWTCGFAKLLHLTNLPYGERSHPCSDMLMDMQFPSLTSLSLHLQNGGIKVNQFKWTMPKLESLHCLSNWDVLSVLLLTALLKDFRLSFNAYTEYYYRDAWVLHFLALPPAASITAMTIDFSKSEYMPLHHSASHVNFGMQLRNLEMLHADFGFSYNSSDAMAFFRYFDMPNVRMLRARVNDRIARGEHLWRWLGRLMQDAERSLETVHVVFAVDYDADDRALLRQRVLDLFPSHQCVVDADGGLQSPGADVVSRRRVLYIIFEDNRSAQEHEISSARAKTAIETGVYTW